SSPGPDRSTRSAPPHGSSRIRPTPDRRRSAHQTGRAPAGSNPDKDQPASPSADPHPLPDPVPSRASPRVRSMDPSDNSAGPQIAESTPPPRETAHRTPKQISPHKQKSAC